MHESDLLPASNRSGANCNAYPQYSWIAKRVTSLNVFCTASAKKLLTQWLLHKYDNFNNTPKMLIPINFEQVRFLRTNIWAMVSQNIKSCKSLQQFKRLIKVWKPQTCPWSMCKKYVANTAFT